MKACTHFVLQLIVKSQKVNFDFLRFCCYYIFLQPPLNVDSTEMARRDLDVCSLHLKSSQVVPIVIT